MMVYKHITASLKPWRAIVSHVDTSKTAKTLVFSIFSIARIMMCTTLRSVRTEDQVVTGSKPDHVLSLDAQ